MPHILPTEAEAAWLDPKQTEGQVGLDVGNVLAVIAVNLYAVSSRVNNSQSAGAELIEPFPNPE